MKRTIRFYPREPFSGLLLSVYLAEAFTDRSNVPVVTSLENGKYFNISYFNGRIPRKHKRFLKSKGRIERTWR